MFRCHVEAFRLFTALIDGRNMHTSEFLLKSAGDFGMNYNLLLTAVGNCNLPNFYRAHLLEFLTEMFLNCEPQYEISFTNLILVSELSLGNPVDDQRNPLLQCFGDTQQTPVSFNGRWTNFPDLQPPEDYADLKQLCENLLQEIGSFKDFKLDNNLLAKQAIITLHQLLCFGKYTHSNGHYPDILDEERKAMLVGVLDHLLKMLTDSGAWFPCLFVNLVTCHYAVCNLVL